MAYASELAEKGRGQVSPNPVVGAVLVRKGKAIAESWHQQVGDRHAERSLLEDFEGRILKNDTLYITLEPCCHQGRTAPCIDILLEKKIKRVVVGCLDPNPEVSGRGLELLTDAGVEVLDLDDDSVKWQNRFFFRWVKDRRPWVSVKIAQTLDGRVVPERGKQVWLTGPESRRHVHEQRALYDVILVGAGTVLADDPRLTVRDLQDQDLENQPQVVILDAALSVPPDKAVIRPGTIVFCGRQFKKRKGQKEALEDRGVKVLDVDTTPEGYLHLHQILAELAARDCVSVYVEGGAAIWSSFVREGLVDELMLYLAPKFLGEGVRSLEDLSFAGIQPVNFREMKVLGDDVLWWGTTKYGTL